MSFTAFNEEEINFLDQNMGVEEFIDDLENVPASRERKMRNDSDVNLDRFCRAKMKIIEMKSACTSLSSKNHDDSENAPVSPSTPSRLPDIPKSASKLISERMKMDVAQGYHPTKLRMWN